MKPLINKKAKVELRRLRNMTKKDLTDKKNLTKGFYRKEPYWWIAFDNTKGNKLVSQWQQERDCKRWLKGEDVNVTAPVYCWYY